MSISEKTASVATAIFVAVVFHVLVSGVAVGSGEGKTHVLEIRSSQFVPVEILVNVGDTIRWVNRDIVPHTATADDKSWDSKLIASGQEWEMTVERDSFTSYFCAFHPGMKANIRVNK